VPTTACDVRDPEQVRTLAAAIRRNFGRIDILVNNPGIAHAATPVRDLPLAVWRDVLGTNLTGRFLTIMPAGGSLASTGPMQPDEFLWDYQLP
jgi:NAD(P)-dependent dehydrogenase (short-subunit alcohol dehydrogenase family)